MSGAAIRPAAWAACICAGLPPHGHGLGAVAAQQLHQGSKVDGLLFVLHGRGRSAPGRCRKTRGRRRCGRSQLGRNGGDVHRLEHHGHHGQLRALEVSEGAGLAHAVNGHETMGIEKGATGGASKPKNVPMQP